MKKAINIKEFLDISVEEIFADRFSRYSKYIIQDRALPDVRDGLKPVQRRIIYSMNKEGNVFDKQFRKSAKTVGNVIGNYHPHGDTSVYDAMIRMSQDWKNNERIVIVHGNNGSIDGDSPAAMRYTEAKLSEYASLMISDINQNTVNMVLNFDDTEEEPVVLPTKVPNLLINGASGISSGYATDIPPHNSEEIIKAAIYVNEHKHPKLDKIMQIVPGPDFPTGGSIHNIEGIEQAYATGKGKITLRAKYRIENGDIIIEEIPYDVNKSQLVQKIDLVRIEKKVDGIDEVLDESDQTGLQITIKLKKEANSLAILNYLFKNTDLQKNYNFNMIAINKRKPELMGIIPMLQAFINHRIDVITRRSQFQLDKAEKKLHILEGLMLAVENLDEVIRIIRSSENKATSKENLILAFNITEAQAEAIVMMQLYRLSNTDLIELNQNKVDLEAEVAQLNSILSSEENIKKVVSEELKQTLKTLKSPRKSQISQEAATIEFNQEDLIKDEEVIVSMTNLGYIKRSSLRSYISSNAMVTLRDEDRIKRVIKANTKDKLLIFLSDGTYAIIQVHQLTDAKYKDVGENISSLCKLNDGVSVVDIIKVKDFSEYDYIIGTTELGYTAKYKFSELDSTKMRQKILMQKIKKDDRLKSITLGKDNQKENIVLITSENRYLAFNPESIKYYNLRTVGAKAGRYKTGETTAFLVNNQSSFIALADDGAYLYPKAGSVDAAEKLTPIFKPLSNRKQKLIKVLIPAGTELIFTTKESQEIIPIKKLDNVGVGEKLKSIKKEPALNLEDVYL